MYRTWICTRRVIIPDQFIDMNLCLISGSSYSDGYYQAKPNPPAYPGLVLDSLSLIAGSFLPTLALERLQGGRNQSPMACLVATASRTRTAGSSAGGWGLSCATQSLISVGHTCCPRSDGWEKPLAWRVGVMCSLAPPSRSPRRPRKCLVHPAVVSQSCAQISSAPCVSGISSTSI